MRKNTYLALLLIVVLTFSGCGGGSEVEQPTTIESGQTDSGSDQSQSESDEVEVISEGTFSSAAVTVGDLNSGISFDMPAGATDESLTLKVESSGGHAMDPEELEAISEPYTLLANEGHMRFDEPVLVTIKVDKEALNADKEDLSEFKIGYYDGDQWVLIEPENIDYDAGTMSFYTYHFSTYLGLNAKDQKLIGDWVSTQAVKKFSDAKDKYVTEVANQTIDMALRKLNIKDTSVTGKVIDSLRNDKEWQEMVKKYEKGDIEGMNQSLQLLIGKKIVENVSDSAMKEALSTISGETGVAWVESGAQALGYAAEGDYTTAARIIGEKLSEDLLIVKAGKIAAETIQGQIDDWKDSEIEAAYKAYKNGADNYFFGYNVDKGDFDEVWNQMRGIGRQLELEAIKIANDNRLEIGFPPLEEYEMEKIRQKVKRDYKEKFEARAANEAKIASEKEQLEILIGEFNKQGFLGSSSKLSKFRDAGYTMEQQLEILKNFADKFMNDTKSTKLTTSIGVKNGETISADYISYAARIYMTKGKEAYNDYLEEEFGISVVPKIGELDGNWTLTSTVAHVPDAFKEEGCELKENQVIPQQCTITTSGNTVTMTTFDSDGEGTSLMFRYDKGVLKWVDNRPSDERDYNVEFNLVAERTWDDIVLKGYLSIGDSRGNILLNMNISR